nr:uncharacterized protein LOC109736842 [Aegilops tauschii subsp. strangulata]
MEDRELTAEEWALRRNLKAKLLGIATIERIRWKQRHRETNDHNEKAAILLDHFKNILVTATPPTSNLNWDCLGIQRANLQHLEEQFTDDEIKRAVFEAHVEKAPGPDGFTGGFFKRFWLLVKHDLLRVFNNLFILKGDQWKILNSANLVLIPKKEGAATPSDYRPISLMHSVAKIICKNVIKDAHQKKKSLLFLKLDFAKASDSIGWGYLLQVMENYGFGQKWRDMVCILLASASSRYERVSMLTTLPCSFNRTSQTCGQCLKLFANASGLKINPTKCVAYPVRCDNPDLVSLLEDFRGSLGSLPCRYLGLPLSLRKPRRIEIQPLLDKLAACLRPWKGRFFTRPGRLLLINSVLTSTLTYYLTAFALDKWAEKQIDKLRRKFLWNVDDEAYGGKCLVNWKRICAPKTVGGLGIKDLTAYSRALRMRWPWYEWDNIDRPWKGTPTLCDASDRQLFAACTAIKIGNGRKASIWTDRWLHGMAPMDIAPDLYKLSRMKNNLCPRWIKQQSMDDWLAQDQFCRISGLVAKHLDGPAADYPL